MTNAPPDFTSISLDAHLAKAGPAAETFARIWQTLWDQSYLPAELLELCRLTLGRLHGDTTETTAPNPNTATGAAFESRKQAVLAGTALDSPLFSDAEKAVLLFAEYYWVDAQSISDDVADAVKVHYSDAAFVFLIEALGCIDGRIRSARCLRDLSAHMSSKEPAHVH